MSRKNQSKKSVLRDAGSSYLKRQCIKYVCIFIVILIAILIIAEFFKTLFSSFSTLVGASVVSLLVFGIVMNKSNNNTPTSADLIANR